MEIAEVIERKEEKDCLDDFIDLGAPQQQKSTEDSEWHIIEGSGYESEGDEEKGLMADSPSILEEGESIFSMENEEGQNLDSDFVFINLDSNNSEQTHEGVSFSEFVDVAKALRVSQPNQRQRKRDRLLQKTLQHLQTLSLTDKSNYLLKYSIRTGGLDRNRRQLWTRLSGLEEFEINHKDFYEDSKRQVFGKKMPVRHHVVPKFGGDLNFEHFYLNEKGMLACQRMLCIFASIKASIDYCPVLPSLICLLLHIMNEDQAFKIAYLMLESPQKYFPTSVRDLTLHLLTFDDLFQKKERYIFNHMKSLGINSEDFMKEWIFNLFVSVLPFLSVLRIFDSYLCEGISVLFRTALAILNISSSLLLQANNKVTFLRTLHDLPHQFSPVILHKKIFRYFIGNQIEKLEEKNKEIISQLQIPEVKFQIYHQPKPNTKSSIATLEMFELLYTMLEDVHKVKDPFLLFSTLVDGFSLTTMIQKAQNHRFTILLIKTADQQVIGGFISDYLKKSKYAYGTGEMFIFSLHPTVVKYPYKRGSNLHYLLINDLIQFGAGGEGSGLELDNELWNGSTHHCLTYDNQPLTGNNPIFEAKTIELWGFY